MKFHYLHLLFLLQAIMCIKDINGQLFINCSSHAECSVPRSYCRSGICTCKSFYAPHKNSSCLPSRFLDQECISEQQCTMKVAESTCFKGKCKCKEGYLKFRSHTCLSAAKPGDVCLSNEHCKLWNKNSYCQFSIPNLIGRCSCNFQTRVYESACLTEEEIMTIFTKEHTTEPLTESPSAWTPNEKSSSGSKELNDSIMVKGNVEVNEYISRIKSPFEEDPFYDQRKHHNKGVTEISTNFEKIKNETIVIQLSQNIEKTTVNTGMKYMEYMEVTTTMMQPSNGSDIELSHLKRFKNIEKISLGLPCVFDSQCQASDKRSFCINNICQCSANISLTNCHGCPPETFQCRSSGACISWFFVCDGRKDCSDGSDEECNGPYCPNHSFQCGEKGICVSRSAICDGTRNCPNGEDEIICGEKNECPEHSFRCNNGQCLPEYEFCNAIPACEDGSDELEGLCGTQLNEDGGNTSVEKYCPFRCMNGRCRSTAIICSGKDGCGDNSDESKCTPCLTVCQIFMQFFGDLQKEKAYQWPDNHVIQ